MKCVSRRLLLFHLLPAMALWQPLKSESPIDRYQLVHRHNPRVNNIDPSSPFTIGNGKFAFTADVTGLQTFADHYHEHGIPLQTLCDWAWHSSPNPQNYTLEDAFEFIAIKNHRIGFPTAQRSPAGQWLRANPHRMPLGQLEFVIDDSVRIQPDQLSNIKQHLDMWSGVLDSRFSIHEQPVQVESACHPIHDLLVFRINSPLLSSGELSVAVRFPYLYDSSIKNNPPVLWNSESHNTILVHEGNNSIVLKRKVDDESYYVSIAMEDSAVIRKKANHTYLLSAKPASPRLEFVITFTLQEEKKVKPTSAEILAASGTAFKSFWQNGGAIDLSGSPDERARELERRIILSQYLTKVNCSGLYPPQETGLTAISWYGKFHTEMVWWHSAHFILWERPELALNHLTWFHKVLPQAQATARQQEFAGARWSKMVGPEGRESPGGNPFILWNQPHPIYLAELLYRNQPQDSVLIRFQDIVFQTAEYMSSFVTWDEKDNDYNLGPPVWLVQETYDPRTAMNPTFELAYWAYGLDLAQHWRERLGMDRVPKWDHIIQHMSKLPQRDGLYVGLESNPDTFTNPAGRRDHPSMLMPLGVLPGIKVDREIMRRTLHQVLASWNWEEKIWGWDYSMIAMTAARLGEPDVAIDILLMDGPNNKYLNNGHCPQRGDLPVYLPANGALLQAAALMAAGWEDAPFDHAPGFPRDGQWTVRYEDIDQMP